MLIALLIPVAILVAQQAQPATVQKSSGWCSPNISNVAGNVTVNCIGVDPRALNRLNQHLVEMKLDRDKAVQVANEWTAKYKELEAQLSKAGDDSVLSRQAEEYLHEGELEKAGAILDQILAKEEPNVSRTAANHYNRGLIFELQFRPLDAIPRLELAYRYRPEVWTYGMEYSYELLNQNDFKKAERVLLDVLDNTRLLAQKKPATYPPKISAALNNLGLVYGSTQRLKEAETAYQESLDIRLPLAKSDPAAMSDVATTLNNLANLYSDTERYKEA